MLVQFLFTFMRIDIITIFPNIFDSYFNESIIKRAQEKKLAEINIHNLRDYTNDKRKTVDDKPYGGGFGMVLMTEPIYRAVKEIKKRKRTQKRKIILLSAKGKKFNQQMAKRFSKLDQLILICGRYEGVDERVAKYIADQEVSIGDYILTGGEVPAMAITDAAIRLIPGVIAEGSLEEESFSKEYNLEFPHYTRPKKVIIEKKERKVPEVLLSGDPQKIKKWQKEKSRSF